jgi:hypothetical protein
MSPNTYHGEPKQQHPPPTQLMQLPEETRKWLANKRDSDLKALDRIIDAYRTVESLGRLSKWLFFALITMIIMLGEVGQAFNRMIAFLTGKGGG